MNLPARDIMKLVDKILVELDQESAKSAESTPANACAGTMAFEHDWIGITPTTTQSYLKGTDDAVIRKRLMQAMPDEFSWDILIGRFAACGCYSFTLEQAKADAEAAYLELLINQLEPNNET